MKGTTSIVPQQGCEAAVAHPNGCHCEACGRDSCLDCAGDCMCGADPSPTPEERAQVARDRARARELFQAAGRPIPAWLRGAA